MDRFEHGLKDAQDARVVAHCANPACEGEIYEGDYVDRFGEDRYCCTRCLFEAQGTVITVEDE
ncbi:hypothetical protein [Paenibacillus sp. ACRRY]|uniref:hypothetical protein n=1 Tax=Paenibacillus sp. ACRRY TaxID=2918208 RepID=UPI001EF5FC59|nr:hypothetical protein [Paenibacillus sp. ACRRY]MCG7385058.1 hypothetical protein [Paenibacillus sp. ACRRY]